jgi:hypothetical protein
MCSLGEIDAELPIAGFLRIFECIGWNVLVLDPDVSIEPHRRVI